MPSLRFEPGAIRSQDGAFTYRPMGQLDLVNKLFVLTKCQKWVFFIRNDIGRDLAGANLMELRATPKTSKIGIFMRAIWNLSCAQLSRAGFKCADNVVTPNHHLAWRNPGRASNCLAPNVQNLNAHFNIKSIPIKTHIETISRVLKKIIGWRRHLVFSSI